ncbi:MAG: hypothetical protein HWD58_03235 [Bacteroidota bacterium]|nr:MAG: hypothetical protein HWD58_03235 [Bacteroidota bacterium]
MGKEYYNLTVGYDIEYAVDSIIYDDFNQRIDTFSLEFKDAVVDTFTDNEGRLSYRIQRYYRQDSTYAWSEHYNFTPLQHPRAWKLLTEICDLLSWFFPSN